MKFKNHYLGIQISKLFLEIEVILIKQYLIAEVLEIYPLLKLYKIFYQRVREYLKN